MKNDQVLDDTVRVRWKIDQTIDRLQSAPASLDYSPEILEQVLAILRQWTASWNGVAPYKSFLDKKSFQHEIEECLPALHHLNEWRQRTRVSRFVVFDVCGGKGCFAMLVQYMASLFWNHHATNYDPNHHSVVDSVILLEKAKRSEIDWHHVLQSNNCPNLVPLHLWDDCNLHSTDSLIDRIRSSIPYPVAATGIHLCKLLSPALVSVVNLLGPIQCPYLCLVPCCMPRAVTKTAQRHNHRKQEQAPTRVGPVSAGVPVPNNGGSFVSISMYETDIERQERFTRIQRRDAAQRRKGRHTERLGTVDSESATNPPQIAGCFCCQSTLHQLRFCPEVQRMPEEERRRILLASLPSFVATPCWNCGLSGHYQVNCPNPRIATVVVNNGSEVTSLLEPPKTLLDVTNILSTGNPMRTYCELLINSIYKEKDPIGGEDGLVSSAIPMAFRSIIEADLVNLKAEKQGQANWNGGRKSLYLIAWTI